MTDPLSPPDSRPAPGAPFASSAPPAPAPRPLLETLAMLFPVWVAFAGASGLVVPAAFAWVSTDLITIGLGLIMLFMGMTLNPADFRAVAQRPQCVVAGVTAQFVIMPFLGWSIAHALELPSGFAAGLILVACCPGGTASNVVAFLARADVALSVVLTTCSTFAAVALTPLLTQWLAGAFIPVDAWALFRSTALVVIIPVVAGLLLRRFAPGLAAALIPAAPLLSGLIVALIVGAILANSAATVLSLAVPLLFAVLLLHIGGFALGYLAGLILQFPAPVNRTLSIEVGMQNSGLGTALARLHFPTEPLAAAACVLSALVHCLVGSAAAAFWRMRTPRPS